MGILDEILNFFFKKEERPKAIEGLPPLEGQKKHGRPLRPFFSKIVGVTFRNADGSNRQQIIAQCAIGERLVLRHTPIPQDANAVAVCRLSGEQLGWLSAELAEDFAPRLDKGGRIDVQISALTGGIGKPRGCNITILKYALR